MGTFPNMKALAQAHWRRQRMAIFLETLRPTAETRILDIGGLPELWKLAPRHLNVTLVNLPQAFQRRPTGEFRASRWWKPISARTRRSPEITI